MASLCAIFSLSRTLDIRTYGAVSGTTAGNASVANRGALTTALNAALPGDTVLVTNGSYYCRGGLALSNLRSVTLQLDGTLVAAQEVTMDNSSVTVGCAFWVRGPCRILGGLY